MYCSREYQLTSRFNQQYEKSTSNLIVLVYRRTVIIYFFKTVLHGMEYFDNIMIALPQDVSHIGGLAVNWWTTL